jgi:hypothetical protein
LRFLFFCYPINRNHPSIAPGTLGFARHQRIWASLSDTNKDAVSVSAFDPRRRVGDDYIIGSITVEIRLLPEKPIDIVFEAEAMEKFFRQASPVFCLFATVCISLPSLRNNKNR